LKSVAFVLSPGHFPPPPSPKWSGDGFTRPAQLPPGGPFLFLAQRAGTSPANYFTDPEAGSL